MSDFVVRAADKHSPNRVVKTSIPFDATRIFKRRLLACWIGSALFSENILLFVGLKSA